MTEKQHCDYCNGWISIDEIKNRTLSEKYIKQENHCKEFEFCNIDVINGKEYAPRKQKVQKQADENNLFLTKPSV